MTNKDKKQEVVITETVWEQMAMHARLLAETSTKSAHRLTKDFGLVASALGAMPERFPWFIHDMIPFQKYRKIFCGKYHLVLFEMREDTVYVTSVIDCREDYGWLL